MWDGWVEGRAIWSLGARAGADLGSETLPMGLAVGREGDRTLFLFIETRSSVGGLHRFFVSWIPVHRDWEGWQRGYSLSRQIAAR